MFHRHDRLKYILSTFVQSISVYSWHRFYSLQAAMSAKRQFPFAIDPVDPTMNAHLFRDFWGKSFIPFARGNRTKVIFLSVAGDGDGFVQVGPKKYLFPNVFRKHIESLYTAEIRPDDVWISTYPRSGTTLVQEMAWLINNNLDYERSRREALVMRSIFYE